MGYVLFLLILFVGGGYLIGKELGNFFFPSNDLSKSTITHNPTITHIHHYTTENHLHISKEELSDLIGKQ